MDQQLGGQSAAVSRGKAKVHPPYCAVRRVGRGGVESKQEQDAEESVWSQKPRAQGEAFARPRQTDVSILTLFPMILSPDDLLP